MRNTTLVLYLLMFGFGSLFVPDASGQLIISEFRVRGPNGANDEFIELYNNSGADHTVAGGGTGYGVAASNGVARCVIPNGTVIPNRGHYLCVNSVGYSLSSYPAGNGTTATGDATYTTDIPDNAGIAIFNTSVAGSFILANRLDAVGSTSEANTLYKEGTGYPALTPFSIDYSFNRDECGKAGSIINFVPCPIGGKKDTNNNASDFIFNDTNGTSAGAGQRLGAPGPQNLSSPIGSSSSFGSYAIDNLDSCISHLAPPNRVRDLTSDPANNSTFGTMDFRLRLTNNTGGATTRLRFRIVDLTTFPAPASIADLRPRTSTAVVVTVDRPPCGSGNSNVTVQGTTLEQPPSQPNGGGFNSSMSAGTVTLGTPLANGASLDIRLLMGIQQKGSYRFGVYLETLPGGSAFRQFVGSTEKVDKSVDFDGDRRTDISIFRPTGGQWWHRRSSNGVVAAAAFGLSSDKQMPGDYTGDGLADRVFFRPSTGQWFVMKSEDSSFFALPFGSSGDIPVAGDYDADGTSDYAVFRPSTATWYIRRSTDGGTTITPWGVSTDDPVPADYDGDGRADLAIYRPSNGQWWISYSGTGTFATTFGTSADRAVPGDYTGDGKADVAVWRPSTGTWFVLRSEDFQFYSFPFGAPADVPSPGDYDGDGKSDAALFRPSNATWYIQNAAGITIMQFGLGSDVSLPSVFVP